MNLTDYSLKKPITTFMIFIAIVVIGFFSLSRLAIDLLPDIEFPSLTVSVSYPGASPKEVETLITEPLERAVSTIQNVKQVRSSSNEGRSSVTMDFNWGTDMTEATNDLREKIDRIKGALPEEADTPSIWKFDPSSMPIMFLGFVGDMPLDEIREYADNQIRYRLEQIEGVAAVDIRGGLEREIHVDINKSKMEALGITYPQIISALRNENLDMPGGYLETQRNELLLRTSGQYTSLEQLKNTVIIRKSGTPIYLYQVADVIDSFKETRSDTRLMGKAGISLTVQKQPAQNTVKVSNNVTKRIEEINKALPSGMKLFIARDSSEFIRNSIKQAQQAGLWGGILAILILVIFLRNIRSVIIIGVGIPVSIVATFILMNLAGLTLNMMSLGGLALGIGMLLDNSIVVLENIFRHREWGEDPNHASSVGTREVSGAIIASTATTLCVFLPLLFASGGIQGIFFNQLAYTVSFSLLCSLFVALTLVPVMSAKLLHVSPESELNSQKNNGLLKIKKGLTFWFDIMNDRYKIALGWALDHRAFVVIVCPLILILVVLLIPTIGTELMPEVDEGNIAINITLPVGTKMQITDELTRRIEKIVEETVPEIRTIRTNVGSGGGFGGASGTHSSNINISLVNKKLRNRTTNDIITALRKAIPNMPDTRIWVSSSGSIMTRIMTGGQQTRIEVEIRGYDLDTGAILAEDVKKIVESVSGTVNVRVNREEGKPELTVHIDRDKASTLGLNLSTIANTLNTGLTGVVATKYREGGEEYDVRVRLKKMDRLSLDNIKNITINTGANSVVSLNNISKIQESKAPIGIERRSQERVIIVSADPSGRDLGSIGDDINQKLASLQIPDGFKVRLIGEQEEQVKAYRSLIFTLLLAIALVYMVMASQFESLLHPFIIMFSIPFATIGVVLILFLTGTNFSITVFIGVIMLAGIVVNNAIVLVDYINLMRSQGLDLREAILESGRRRLRPILMTTLTTSFALIPMSLGIGEGAEMQAPMARTVLGGLIIATTFTLFFIPTLYDLFEVAREKRKAKRKTV
ncbi:TPA: efflux RND transporter permease subunit [bacterium]|nr:efflux RND transporter permease subunit [bacterium]